MECADSDADAIKLAKQVAFVHGKGSFFMRYWKSNSKQVMKVLGEFEESSDVSIGSQLCELTTEKVLGM